ncbi:MAG: IclR family transcriptional regulator [Ottowia sp.]|uniref:IclR family transcriptional regulator n=1 Tax=Ottowia sp. TaxID=1898956 RepID=UPI003C735B60
MHNLPDSAPKARAGTQSLQRAVALLRALMSASGSGASVAELAEFTEIDRTTAHRMLRCLDEEGLATQDPRSRRYSLGPLAYELGVAAAGRLDLRVLCEPVLRSIAADTEDTVFLIIRSGDESVCIDRAEGSYPVRALVVDVGTRRPLGVGAGSLAILAALQPSERENLITRNASRISAYEKLTLPKLRQQIQRAQADGHVALDVVGVNEVRAVAVPIRTNAGHAIAALSISAVRSRMSEVREAALIKRLHRESSAIGELLEKR